VKKTDGASGVDDCRPVGLRSVPYSLTARATVESVVGMTKRGAVVRAASSIHRFIMQTRVINQRVLLLKDRFSEKF
jgi:hypothetical protein